MSCYPWRLYPSMDKTEVCCFHLNNKEANKKLSVIFNGIALKHNFNPKYLGDILDRSLTHKAHCEKLAGKPKTRNNVIQKLAGTTWEASANVLRTSAMALVFSTAQYCAPIWMNSFHTSKGKTNRTVGNSTEFKRKISRARLPKSYELLQLDATSVFTK